MALRDLLVHVDLGEPGLVRLRLAAGLAARHQARLVVLHVRELSLSQQRRLRVSELGLVSSAEVEALNQEIAHEQEEGEAPLRSLLEQVRRDQRIEAVYRSLDGHAAELVIQQARTADLAIIGHDLAIGEHQPDEYSFAETMLFASGRPLLLLPPRAAASQPLGRCLAIAWNGSRPAARALSDAIPLIEKADRVVVLSAQPDRPDVRAPSSIEPVLANLRCHSSVVESLVLQARHRDVADVLQAEALALGADLLVAGAYGHARLWEKMLGGVTRDLLADLRLPVLMSH